MRGVPTTALAPRSVRGAPPLPASRSGGRVCPVGGRLPPRAGGGPGACARPPTVKLGGVGWRARHSLGDGGSAGRTIGARGIGGPAMCGKSEGQRQLENALQRQRYAEDPAYRDRKLAACRNRYAEDEEFRNDAKERSRRDNKKNRGKKKEK